MDRTKLFHFAAGLALVGALVGLDLLGSRVSDATHASGSLVLGLMLWQVRGWFAKPDAAPAPAQVPPLPILLTLALLGPVVVGPFLACSPSATPQAGAVPAASCLVRRTTRQLECVDLYSTKAEIDACRAKVVAALDCTDGGFVVTLTDAGKE